MVVRNASMLALSIFIAACDTFHGPKIKNDWGAGVSYSAYYSDGKRYNGNLLYCNSTFIGRGDAELIFLKIYKADGKSYSLSKDDIDRLLEAEQQAEGSYVWSIDDRGLKFSRQLKNGCIIIEQ